MITLMNINGIGVNPNQVTCIESEDDGSSYLVRLSDGTVFRNVPYYALENFFYPIPPSSGKYKSLGDIILSNMTKDSTKTFIREIYDFRSYRYPNKIFLQGQ